MSIARVRFNNLGNLPPYLLPNSIRSLDIRSPAALTPDKSRTHRSLIRVL